jgi:hypothetical protein
MQLLQAETSATSFCVVLEARRILHVTGCNAIRICQASDTPQKLMVTTLVHTNYGLHRCE